MSGFYHTFLSVVVNSIAWLIITLQVIALSHLSLPCTEGRFPFSPNSFSAQMWCFCAGTKATVYHNVFFLCLERVLECMLLTAIKMFCSVTFLLQLTVCLVRVQTLGLILLKFLSPALKIINYQRIRQHSRNQKGFSC